MRLFRRKPETRANGGGDFYNAVVAQIQADAATKSADAGGTAAIEAAAGQLARAFAAAKCDHPAVTPRFLNQYGRDLIRGGASLHRLDMAAGALTLTPVSQWHWVGHGANPDAWTVNATDYGPSGSRTSWLPYSAVVWGTWGVTAATPWVGRGPASWAGLTAKLAGEAERSLGDESAGPVAQIITMPEGDSDDSDDERRGRLDKLKADLKAKRGDVSLVESTADGHGEGAAGAPHRDWVPERLGPQYPREVVEAARDGYERLLAACGTSVSLFSDADGTAQREALRRWHMGTVLPLAALLEAELTVKLETPITLTFDSYPLDIVGRASAVATLVQGAGMSLDEATRTVLLLDG